MKIGIVDLDTSHPAAWLPIEREMGHEIAGVWDGGSVHPKGYAEKFAAEHRIPRVHLSFAEMAEDVDCAILHGCDWDLHVEKARPFVEAGKAVFIDKPIAGKLDDLKQIRKWAEQGARIAGGSSLRFCSEIQEWRATPLEKRGIPHTVVCGCGVDEFNYGIHAYSMLSGIMGSGIHSARHLGQGTHRRIQVNWTDGRTGFLILGQQNTWLPFHATIVTEKTVTHLQADSNKIYQAILEATLPYLSRKTESPPVEIPDLLEPELAALAARQSWLRGDCEVQLSDLMENDPGYDGASFAVEYRRMKYGT